MLNTQMFNTTDLLGWGSSGILLATLIRQVYTQWRTRATAGVSKWLFVGQCTASVGYVLYSWRLHNWVYVCSNLAILLTALVGESLFVRNRRLAARREAP
jgi:uncharacterized protein with PQ loop repeat